MILQTDDDSPSSSQRLIQPGDLVVVYERHDSMKSVYVTPGENFGNRYGNFKHKDWVGKPFGSRVQAAGQNARGWVYLLAPTPELWTLVLKHRTQILYVADISMVCTFLELKPGCTVLESGTGSGSLTHSLARAVAPTGHVHTFEFHQVRAEAADKEFQQHGMGDLISVQQRNIEDLGFPEGFHGKADGIFLDLPGPWHAVESAAKSLRPDGVFCAFSPCIEQVQRTCAALEEQDFYAVRTVECLLRHYEVKEEKFATYEDLEGQDTQQAGTKRKRQEEHLSSKRAAVAIQDATATGPPASLQDPAQVANGAPAPAEAVLTAIQFTAASVQPPQAPDLLQANSAVNGDCESIVNPAVPVRSPAGPLQVQGDIADIVGKASYQQDAVTAGMQITAVHKSQHVDLASMSAVPAASQQDGAEADVASCTLMKAKTRPTAEQIVVAKPVSDARGHTGYLTFARRSVDD